MARVVSIGLTLGAFGLVLTECLSPTEVKVVLTTDLPCNQLHGARIAVGPLGVGLDTATASATADQCDDSVTPHSLGTITLVPGGNRDAPVAIEVVAATTGVLDKCSASAPGGCIIARRSLSYIAHTPLTLPIALEGSCVGKPCEPNETCVGGTCKGATIKCDSSNNCDPSTLPDLDGGTDGGTTLASGRLSVGGQSTCYDGSGGLKCWGVSVLGDGTMQGGYHNTPEMPVPLASLATQVSEGGSFACALLDSKDVVCWGDDKYGAVSGTTSGKFATTPVPVQGLVGAVEIATGLHHACARLQDGSVVCWGDDAFGQIGDALVDPRPHPLTHVLLPSVAVAIGSGPAADATCAILANGDVTCWGYGGWGQLGPQASGKAIAATKVNLGLAAKSISLGKEHACAVMTDGTARCWGTDESGQLGDGVLPTPGVPKVSAPVIGLSNVLSISAGLLHTCALLASGAIKCWGDNSNMQLGNGTMTGSSSTPAPVVGLPSNAIAVSAGGFVTCALFAADVVWCWGQGGQAGLGDNSGINGSPTPVKVKNLP